MLALHDYKCEKCGEISEMIVDHGMNELDCPECGGRAVKTFENWDDRKPMKFPEGQFVGLSDEPHIDSRRKLREACKREGKDEFTECYAKYDDGYAGF